jgi:hypothetical protein
MTRVASLIMLLIGIPALIFAIFYYCRMWKGWLD